METKRIHIIGPSGSGKTYIARKLEKKIGVRACDLDDFFWDNRKEDYGIRRDSVERDKLLENVISQEKWLIEGVYYKWVTKSLETADVVIYLDINYILLAYRIIKRFILRKIGITANKKKETVKGLLELMKWNKSYCYELKQFIIGVMKKRNVKVLKKKSEINRLIKQ